MDGIAPKYLMNFGTADRLSVFEQYQFFTPALLYIYGRFNDRPLFEFMEHYGREVRIMHHLFDVPIFCGMTTPDGNADWNRVLWAVDAEVWPALEQFLLSVTFTDKATRTVIRVGSQDIAIVDPLHRQVGRRSLWPLPVLPIVTLGVDSTRGCAAVSISKTGQPYVRFHPPQDKTLAFAKLLAAGENPNHALEVPPALPDPIKLRLEEIAALSPEERALVEAGVEDYRKEIR